MKTTGALLFAMFLLANSAHAGSGGSDINGDTTGYGINLQVGRLVGFRLDHARVPQARGLPNVFRDNWSVWVDPIAIMNQ